MAILDDVPEAAYAALSRIRFVALDGFSSLFTPDRQLWTAHNLAQLEALFVRRFELGSGDFFEKFREQLSGASNDCIQLAAELLYTQQFFTTLSGPERKLENVRVVLSWSSRPLDIPAWAADALRAEGFASDRSFNQHRPHHLAWLIEFLSDWHQRANRPDLLADPWRFRQHTLSIEGSHGAHQPMREAWLYIAFPHYFEAITSRTDKGAIREAFLQELGHPPSDNIDADLFRIRQYLTPHYGVGYHYYRPPVADRWRGTDNTPGSLPHVPRERILEALREFDHNQRDRPEWAAWDAHPHYRYALEHENRRYPPKHIVSLATGRLKSTFSGGEQTNDYLTERGFTVVRLRQREEAGTSSAEASSRSLSLAEAAQRVLADAGVPMSVADLWAAITERGLYQSSHSAPYRALYTVLYRGSTDNDSETGPERRPFVRTAPSTFGLASHGHAAMERPLREPRPPSKRDILELLKRSELQHAVDHYGLNAGDRRVNENLVDALVRSKRVRISEVLGWLSRDRLKDICIALELSDVGREKAVLIDRILGEPSSTDSDERGQAASTAGGEDASALLARLLGPTLVTQELSDGWPSRGALVLEGRAYDVSIYVRQVGGSARGNPLERRFQNPAQQRPIVDEPDRYELLFGLWTEQGDERAVICAFDAYRRMDRTTRFSMFMPLSLLEQAADTGFASHENNHGETLYAFRPENIGRYLQTFLQNETWHTQPEEEAAPKRKADLQAAQALAPARDDNVYIRPQVGMYSAFARLNYRPWFALSEFLDNSIQSFLHNRDALNQAGHTGPLVIDINLDDNELSVTDRAGGIAWKDFPRAFSPASPPDDATGLSEFGLGMKAAACWFSRKWQVRTSALGEPVERTVTFDIPRISREGLENLPIETRPCREGDHFTVITMQDLRVQPRGRTLTKIREHLSSIYRVLMKEDIVRLRLTMGGRTEELRYEEPELLIAVYHRTPHAQPRLWRQEFVVDLGDKRVTGWAGIMKVGSHVRAGFSVFRRRRLIEGSVGETYKPQLIFGSPNSFASFRVVGEIFVEGFDVTHTKDGIQWGGYEDEVLESIRRQIDSPQMPLLDQAEGYRVRKRAESLPIEFGQEALGETADALAEASASKSLNIPAHHVEAEDSPPSAETTEPVVMQQRTIRLNVMRDGQPWEIQLELVRDPAMDFYTTSITRDQDRDLISVRINLDHEFSVSYINNNETALQPLVRFIAALALGEKAARDSGVRNAGAVRQNANSILRTIATDRPHHRA